MNEEGIKISEMTELTSITGNEYFPVVDSLGENKKVKTEKFATKDMLNNTTQIVKETDEVVI